MTDWQQELDNNFTGILISEAEIKKKIEELGRQITAHYASLDADQLIVIGILRGSVLFLSDLIRELKMPITIDFMAVSSYEDKVQSSGTLRIIKDISESISQKHVLVIEDIIDSGITLRCLKDMLWARNPRSLNICSLLDKPARRQTNIEVDFRGFEVPDEFLVGYGLDYAGRYRHLPYVAILNPEVYSNG